MVSGLSGLSGLSALVAAGFATASYVAAKLPNVPTAERQPLADAANTAASGQPFTGKQVIDTLTLAAHCFVLKLGAHIFQNNDGSGNGAGSGAAAIGSPIGYVQSWVGASVAVQTGSARPTLTANGGSHDGADDRLVWLIPTGMKAANAKTNILIFKTSSTSRFDPYGTRVNNGGIDNTGTGYVYIFSSGTPLALNYANVGGGSRVTTNVYTASAETILRTRNDASANYDLYVNGSLKDGPVTVAAGTTENSAGYMAFGYQTSTTVAFNGTCRLILGFPQYLSNLQATQMDRLWDAYFNLRLIP